MRRHFAILALVLASGCDRTTAPVAAPTNSATSADDMSFASITALPNGDAYATDVMNGNIWFLHRGQATRVKFSATDSSQAPAVRFAAPFNERIQPAGLAGSFVGDCLSIDIEPAQGDTYTGLIHKGSRQVPFECRIKSDQLTGTYQGNGYSYDFTGTLSGDVLTLETAGARYSMTRMTTQPASRLTGN